MFVRLRMTPKIFTVSRVGRMQLNVREKGTVKIMTNGRMRGNETPKESKRTNFRL